METYVIQLSESEGHFEYFNERKVIWESFKENGKLTTILSDLTEKLKEIQQNANNKKDREIYNQMRWTEYLLILQKNDVNPKNICFITSALFKQLANIFIFMHLVAMIHQEKYCHQW